MVERNFQSAGARLLTIEGEVGKPPDLKPVATQWKGARSLNTTLRVLDCFVRLQQIRELGRVKDLSKTSGRDTRMFKVTLELFKSLVDMNLMWMLASTVRFLEKEVLDLQDFVKDSGEIILKIVIGKIYITAIRAVRWWGGSRRGDSSSI